MECAASAAQLACGEIDLMKIQVDSGQRGIDLSDAAAAELQTLLSVRRHSSQNTRTAAHQTSVTVSVSPTCLLSATCDVVSVPDA